METRTIAGTSKAGTSMTMRSSKMVKVPHELVKSLNKKESLKLDGMSVIEFCFYTEGIKGTYFLQDHLLLIVKSGVYTVRFGNQEYTMRSNEMMFIHKSIGVQYEKAGEPDSDYILDYMMFFLNEKVVNEFLRFAGLKPMYLVNDVVPITVFPINDRIGSYIESLKPYFENPDEVKEGLVRVKLMELLFHIADSNDRFLHQMMQPISKDRDSIAKIMEENFLNPVSLNDLAYLSGRSLATFKRDFQAIYHTSPLKWVRNRRLDKAKELLAETALSVTDVCFSTGFENIAHFSKVFKERFGLPPSEFRQHLRLKEEA
ncbi:helix-turn-helix domain-containing protein [Paenibacillus hexagrammi]|uniref:AraC family transcriptional regulator n=1 Tax=Paenibacillus hexagrammi TaxID=2908839 RepID=A0ABY3SJL5_9BACL|nr:AraC family transcriptional regulator [Paenibacillus sp. YPD9-1]UJF33411.1 AraC family transcriptional regulator [Paenibacillus sp. YPD9-1]